MQVDEFKKRLGETRIIDSPNFKFKYLKIKDLIEQYKNLKLITELIDFKCNFDKQGYCKTERAYESKNRNGACCCQHCFYEIGYLKLIDSSDLPEYAKRFNEKTGFWRKNRGCTLPRKLRSTTCVTFNCNYISNRFCYSLSSLHDTLCDIEQKIFSLYKKLNTE